MAAQCWDHIGSAQDEAQLAMLLEMARARLHAGQQMLPLEENATTTGRGRRTREPVVEQTASLIVWEALEAVYAWLGFTKSATTRSRRWCWPGSLSHATAGVTESPAAAVQSLRSSTRPVEHATRSAMRSGVLKNRGRRRLPVDELYRQLFNGLELPDTQVRAVYVVQRTEADVAAALIPRRGGLPLEDRHRLMNRRIFQYGALKGPTSRSGLVSQLVKTLSGTACRRAIRPAIDLVGPSFVVIVTTAETAPQTPASGRLAIAEIVYQGASQVLQ